MAFKYCVQSADIGRQQDRRKQQEQVNERIGEQMFGLTLSPTFDRALPQCATNHDRTRRDRTATVDLIRASERPEEDHRRRQPLGMDGDLPFGLGQATAILHSSSSPCAPILEIDLSARR